MSARVPSRSPWALTAASYQVSWTGGNRTLGDVRVTMFSDADCQTPAGTTTNGREWLIADIPTGTDRLFYGNGKWFEVGASFIQNLEEELTRLFMEPKTVTLPPWPKGPLNSEGHDSHDEDWYNKLAAKQSGYLLFDKKNVRTGNFRGGGLEICDLLGPENQLICVKKATSSTAPPPPLLPGRGRRRDTAQ